jgi:TonB family protein
MIISTLMAPTVMVSSLALAATETAQNPKVTRAKASAPVAPPLPPAPPPPAPAPPPTPSYTPPALAPLTGKARHAAPLGNPGAWATTDDYPLSAIRNEEAGVTSFKLTIGTDGKVTNCVITSSSGSAALDEATCRLVKERAMFTPALDRRGKPTEDHYFNRIRWVLPSGDVPDLESGMSDIEVDMGPSGRVEACRILAQEGAAKNNPNPCPLLIGKPSPFPLSDAQKAQNKRWVVRYRMQINVRERN